MISRLLGLVTTVPFKLRGSFEGVCRNKLLSSLGLVAASLVLTGCSLANAPLIGRFFGGSGSSHVTLTYWGLWEPKEVIEPLINEYVSENPNVTIDYQERSFSDLESYKETLLTRLKLDEESSIDIMRIHNTWVPDFVSYLAPLPSDVLSPDKYAERFYSVAMDSAKIGKNIYAIPLEYDGLVLVYNEEMFAEAEIESPPQTWEEFKVAASRLTKKKEDGKTITRAGAAIGTADNVPHASDILGLMWAQSSVNIPEDLSSQAAADALVFYTNFTRRDRVWDETFPSSVIAFAGQKVAMIIVPTWRVLDIINLNPTLKFSVTSVPQVPNLEGGTSNITWASFWMEAVSAKSAGSAEAWRFIEWLSQPDQQQKLFSEASKIREFGEPYSNKDLMGSLKVSKYLASLIEGAPYAKTSVISDSSGNGNYTEAVKAAIRAVVGGASPNMALETAQKEIEQLLSRGGAGSLSQ